MLDLVSKALQFIPLLLLGWFGLYMLALLKFPDMLAGFLGEEETFWGKVRKTILFFCVFVPLMAGGFEIIINSRLVERWDEDLVMVFIGMPLLVICAMTSFSVVVFGILRQSLHEHEASKEEERRWREELNRKVAEKKREELEQGDK